MSRGNRWLLPVAAGLLLGALACSDDDNSNASANSGGSTSAGVGGGGGAPRDGVFQVERYEYAFDISNGNAQATLLGHAETAAECFAFASQLPVAAAQLNDVPASTSLDNGVLSACGATVDGDGVFQADVVVPEQTFLGLDVGFSRKANLAGGQFSYLLSWVGGCDYFGPCDDHPARFAEFQFDVSHPAGTTVLCPGALEAGATQTRCTLAGDALAPTYSAFAIAADAQWQRQPYLTAGGVELVFYEVPGGKLASSLDLAKVGAFMDWITEQLGGYPYGNELRIAGAPTAWLGFEHPGNIILREDLPDLNVAYSDPLMHVFMHEVVHQWAGDRTTLANTADFVWKEAIAEYLPYVFEDTFGDPGEAAVTRGYWKAASKDAAHYPRPTDEPTPAVESFYGDVYGPGPMVLFLQLEALIGREAVLAGIQLHLNEPTAVGVDDLRAALEQASGEDLQAYFNAWVFGQGMPQRPTFSLASEQLGDQLTVTLSQQGESLYGCVVEVDVSSLGGTQTLTFDYGLTPASADRVVTVTMADPLQDTVFDPRKRLLGSLVTAGNGKTSTATSNSRHGAGIAQQRNQPARGWLFY